MEVVLAEPSSKIVAIARSEKILTSLQEKYGEEKFQFVSGDVTDSETSKAAVELLVSKFGKLDSVILNAGALDPVESIANLNVADWKRLFDINFFSILDLTHQALPHLRKTNGSVIMVSSGASTKSTFGWALYGASKLLLNHFCLSLALEEPEISTVSIAPGVVDTKMQEDIREVFGTNMTKDGLARFIELKEKGELLDPKVPATIYANLALKGIPKELNGVYLRYNDERLESFS